MKWLALMCVVVCTLEGCAWGQGVEGCPTSGFTTLNPAEYQAKEAAYASPQVIRD